MGDNNGGSVIMISVVNKLTVAYYICIILNNNLFPVRVCSSVDTSSWKATADRG